jgi:twitching motility protein PilT
MIATSLVGIIAQVLLPKIGGGRVAVPEIMIPNHAIANLIREDKVHQLYSQMQLGQGATGMQTQTQILIKLRKQGLITREDALQYANKPDELEKNINFK